MNYSKGSIYWQIFSELWGFFKKYADGRAANEDWHGFCEAGNALVNKFKNSPQEEFARELGVAAVKELGKIYKRKEVE